MLFIEINHKKIKGKLCIIYISTLCTYVNVYTNKPLSVCKPHTHKFYILRPCIVIVMFVAVERISYDELG
jgi:hypothetical protein